MRVLVTGGLGFQGCHLVKTLIARGDDVTILAQPSARAFASLGRLDTEIVALHGLGGTHASKPNVVWGSVTSPLLVRTLLDGDRDFDVVVHMAALANPEHCRERPLDAYTVNVRGTQNVLDALREVYGARYALGVDLKPHLVHISTCEVYGPARLDPFASTRIPLRIVQLPQDEDSPTDPPHVYGASKLAADALVRAYAHEFGIKATILRPCNAYGPGQRAGFYGAVIPTMTWHALTTGRITVHGGTQSREFMYIDDLVHAYRTIIDRVVHWRAWQTSEPPTPEIYNFGSGERVSIAQIAGQISAHLGGVEIITMPGRVAEPNAFCLDSSRAERLLGKLSTIPFAIGLARYIDWAKAAQV